MQEINECESNPCLNYGYCIDGLDSFTCQCPEGYLGPICEELFDACASNPCGNGGNCTTEKPSPFFSCYCPYGFEGLKKFKKNKPI